MVLISEVKIHKVGGEEERRGGEKERRREGEEERRRRGAEERRRETNLRRTDPGSTPNQGWSARQRKRSAQTSSIVHESEVTQA